MVVQAKKSDIAPVGSLVFEARPGDAITVLLASQSRRGRPKGSAGKADHHKQHSVHVRPLSGPTDQIENPSTVSKFQFIDTVQKSTPKAIDASTRRTIRRHVMLDHWRKQESQSATSTLTKMSSKASLSFSTSLRSPLTHSVDPFDATQIKMEPYMHDLLSYYLNNAWRLLYSIEQYCGLNPVADYWIPIAFQDPAFLHVLLCCASSFAVAGGSIRLRPTAMRHMHAAMTIMSKRLSLGGAETVSDGTIMVVLSIAILDKVAGFHERWNAHMLGLKRLIALRGGMQTLEGKPMLLSKLYRADLCGSIDAMVVPHFSNGPSSDFLPFITSALQEDSSASETIGSALMPLKETIGLDRRLENIATELEHLCGCMSRLNNSQKAAGDYEDGISRAASNAANEKDAAKVRFGLTAAQYALLSLGPLYTAPDSTWPPPLNSPRERHLDTRADDCNAKPRENGISTRKDLEDEIEYAKKQQEIVRLSLILFIASLTNEYPAGAAMHDRLIHRFMQLAASAHTHNSTPDPPAPSQGQQAQWFSFLHWSAFLCCSLVVDAALEGECLALFAATCPCHLGPSREEKDTTTTVEWVACMHCRRRPDRLRQWLWVPVVHEHLLAQVRRKQRASSPDPDPPAAAVQTVEE